MSDAIAGSSTAAHPDEAEAPATALAPAPFGPKLPDKRTTHRPTLDKPRPCSCLPSGRNLVVCIDGTSNKFGEKNTNVVELYSRLIKDPKTQLTYYNSGIGTYAEPLLRSASFVGRMKRVIGYQRDLLFAWRFDKNLLDAYHWLVDNYEPEDRIFLFGFSRGAYQVRVLSAMIDSVGLLHKGNHEQIPFAYDLYTQRGDLTPVSWWAKLRKRFNLAGSDAQTAAHPTSPAILPQSDTRFSPHHQPADSQVIAETGKPSTTGNQKMQKTAAKDPKAMLQRFKDTFSRQVHVHFIGAWDTVSSVGLVHKSLPGTTHGMGHICYFRHALALHERRVKFQPEFACGALGPDSLYTVQQLLTSGEDSAAPSPDRTHSQGSRLSMPHTKEVWFAGSHSQIGGGDVDNPNMDKFGPALRWVAFEAELTGLRLKQDPESWEAEDLTIHKSLTRKWRVFECLPISRLRYGPDSEETATAATCNARISTLIKRILRRKTTVIRFDQTTHQPNWAHPRHVQPGQRIHETAFDYKRTATGLPATEWMASLPGAARVTVDGSSMWETLERSLDESQALLESLQRIEGLKALRDMYIESDAYTTARQTLQKIWKRKGDLPGKEERTRLQKASFTKPGRRSLLDCMKDDPSVELILAHFLNLCITHATPTENQPQPPLSEDLVGTCICAFRALLVVKPDLETNLALSRIAESQLYWLGKTDESLRNSCRLVLDPARMDPIRRLGAGISSVDEDLARLFVRSLGTPQLHEIKRSAISTEYFIAIASFPEPTKFVVASDEGTMQICEFDTGIMRQFGTKLKAVWSITVSHDGGCIASGHDDGIRFFSAEDAATSQLYRLGHTQRVCCVAFAPKALILASASKDSTVRLFDVKTQAQKGFSMLHDDGVGHVTFSPDGKLLASGCDDGYIYLWDVETTTLVALCSGHDAPVTTVSFSPDGRYLASGATDWSVRVLCIEDQSDGLTRPPKPVLVHVLEGHTDSIRSVAFSHDSTRLCSVSDDRTPRIWDIASGKLLGVLRGHGNAVNGVLYTSTSDGNGRERIVTCSSDGSVRCWDATDEWTRWDDLKPGKARGVPATLVAVPPQDAPQVVPPSHAQPYSSSHATAALLPQVDNPLQSTSALYHADPTDKPETSPTSPPV